MKDGPLHMTGSASERPLRPRTNALLPNVFDHWTSQKGEEEYDNVSPSCEELPLNGSWTFRWERGTTPPTLDAWKEQEGSKTC